MIRRDGMRVGIGASYGSTTPVNMTFFTLPVFEIASQADQILCTSTDDAESRHFLHGTLSARPGKKSRRHWAALPLAASSTV
jgi:hypothetical protein